MVFCNVIIHTFDCFVGFKRNIVLIYGVWICTVTVYEMSILICPGAVNVWIMHIFTTMHVSMGVMLYNMMLRRVHWTLVWAKGHIVTLILVSIPWLRARLCYATVMIVVIMMEFMISNWMWKP